MADPTDSPQLSAVERDRKLLAEAAERGPLGRLSAYVRLSGPGWLQSAITLGGGSLAGSLYLGVIGGYSLLWVQPLAMILGVIMLSTIGYVTLSTGLRPFPAINEHVSPVLGWSWALAVAAANVIWCMPQHALAYGVLSKNLLPTGWFSEDGAVAQRATALVGDVGTGWAAETARWAAQNSDKLLLSAIILVVCTIITWSYDRGGWGLRLYETVLKVIVAMIVVCFFGVVGVLSFSSTPLDWNGILSGFVPDLRQLVRPAETFTPLLDAVGAAGEPAREYWSDYIVAQQQDIMIAAAATAVGINMTFMYPYSMLRKGWGRGFRGLARFDLSTGMFIPFMLATSCVVIASSARFHTELPIGFSEEGGEDGPIRLVVEEGSPKLGAFNALLEGRNTALASQQADAAEPNEAERRLAAMLVRREAIDLATALEPLTGGKVANYVFGLGVLGMTLSTITVLMLISGFVVAEMLAVPPGGWTTRLGALVAGVGGALWPWFWTGDSQFYLAIVTSVFGFMLLPLAYVTFAALLNSRSLLGDEMPRGATRLLANLLVAIAALTATVAAVYMVWVKSGGFGVAGLAALVVLVGLVAANRANTRRYPQS